MKTCPFCGSEVFIRVVEPHSHRFATWMPDYPGGAFVECTGCTVGMSGDTEEEVTNAWNKRAEG